MRKIVTDDYEFANLIRGRAVYVDKTDLLARLASGRDGTQFFLARPRKTKKGVWIFEFKFNRSAANAVRQIRDRGYADAWRGYRRPVTLVGIKFDPARRNIEMPRVEPWRS